MAGGPALFEEVLADHQRRQDRSTLPNVPQVSTMSPAAWRADTTAAVAAASGSSGPGRVSSTGARRATASGRRICENGRTANRNVTVNTSGYPLKKC